MQTAGEIITVVFGPLATAMGLSDASSAAFVVAFFVALLFFVLLLISMIRSHLNSKRIKNLQEQVVGLRAMSELSGATLSSDGSSVVYQSTGELYGLPLNPQSDNSAHPQWQGDFTGVNEQVAPLASYATANLGKPLGDGGPLTPSTDNRETLQGASAGGAVPAASVPAQVVQVQSQPSSPTGNTPSGVPISEEGKPHTRRTADGRVVFDIPDIADIDDATMPEGRLHKVGSGRIPSIDDVAVAPSVVDEQRAAEASASSAASEPAITGAGPAAFVGQTAPVDVSAVSGKAAARSTALHGDTVRDDGGRDRRQAARAAHAGRGATSARGSRPVSPQGGNGGASFDSEVDAILGSIKANYRSSSDQ